MKDLNAISVLLEKYTLQEVNIAGYQQFIQLAAQFAAKKGKLEIAQRMKEKGIENSFIIEMTGLSEAELTAL